MVDFGSLRRQQRLTDASRAAYHADVSRRNELVEQAARSGMLAEDIAAALQVTPVMVHKILTARARRAAAREGNDG